MLVMIHGKPVLDHSSDRPMAVGSAFKLVVLKAYEDAIKAGKIKRNQVAILEDITVPCRRGRFRNCRPAPR